MAKVRMVVEIDEDLKDAFSNAAKMQGRSQANMLEEVIKEWGFAQYDKAQKAFVDALENRDKIVIEEGEKGFEVLLNLYAAKKGVFQKFQVIAMDEAGELDQFIVKGAK